MIEDLPPVGIVDLLQLGSCSPDDLPETLPELQKLRDEAESLSTLLRTIRSQIDTEIRRHLGSGGAMAWGDRRFVNEDSHVWEWSDPNGILEWLGADAGRAVNGSHVRKSDVEAIARLRAEKHHEDPDNAVRLVLDTFGRYKDTGKLKILPADRAPVWTRGLEHGQTATKES